MSHPTAYACFPVQYNSWKVILGVLIADTGYAAEFIWLELSLESWVWVYAEAEFGEMEF